MCTAQEYGGFLGESRWESNIEHLFPVGELNETHGTYRPGGLALNSGQVGGMRGQPFILPKGIATSRLQKQDFWRRAGDQIEKDLRHI